MVWEGVWCRCVCVCECERVILDFFLCLLILYYLLDVKYVHTMRHGNGTCKTVQIFLLITSVKSTNMIPKIEFKSKWTEWSTRSMLACISNPYAFTVFSIRSHRESTVEWCSVFSFALDPRSNLIINSYTLGHVLIEVDLRNIFIELYELCALCSH